MNTQTRNPVPSRMIEAPIHPFPILHNRNGITTQATPIASAAQGKLVFLIGGGGRRIARFSSVCALGRRRFSVILDFCGARVLLRATGKLGKYASQLAPTDGPMATR